MATTMTVPEHYQIKYGQMWREKLQQGKNRLLPYVTYKTDCRGRYATIEQVDIVDLTEKTSRHEESQLHDPTTSRRFLFPRSFNRMVGFDEDDGWKLNSIEVPIMPVAEQLWKAGQRKMESVIFDGIKASNTVGNGEDEAQTTETFAAGNIIGIQVGSSNGATNCDMTAGKIREAVELMMTNEALNPDNPDDTAVLALSARQINALWEELTITSRDYTNSGTLDSGKLENWLGLKILRSQQTPTDPSTATTRWAMAWVKSKVHFGIFDNWQSRMWIHNESGGTRYRVKFSAGACREEMNGVYRLLCDETAAFGA